MFRRREVREQVVYRLESLRLQLELARPPDKGRTGIHEVGHGHGPGDGYTVLEVCQELRISPWELDGVVRIPRVGPADAGLLLPLRIDGPNLISGIVPVADRKSTRLNSSHLVISYAVFCLKKKKT